MFVKICGLTTLAAVQAAVANGADAVGFVFAQSPRRVHPEVAKSLCETVPANVIRVAVMRHPGADEWSAVRDVFEPDWLQTDVADLASRQLTRPFHRPYRVSRQTPAHAPQQRACHPVR